MEPVLDPPQSQEHSWKSVVLCMVTEQTKSHMSPRINAPGNSKRQATTNVFSITNTFSCTAQTHGFGDWCLLSKSGIAATYQQSKDNVTAFKTG